MDTTSVTLLERLNKAPSAADWNRFVQLYTPLLFSWVRRTGLNENDASDMVQDILTALLEKLPNFTYDGKKAFGAG